MPATLRLISISNFIPYVCAFENLKLVIAQIRLFCGIEVASKVQEQLGQIIP